MSRRILSSEQREKNKERYRRWVAANREKHNATVRAYRQRRYEKEGCWRDNGPKSVAMKTWMVELKAKPCSDCGGTFPTCCMDFDHREGATKEFNIGSMFAHHYSRELIQKELEKCDLVCANCHRIRTAKRRVGQPRQKYKPRKPYGRLEQLDPVSTISENPAFIERDFNT